MRTTGLLARSSSGDGLDSALEEVAELEGLNEVAVAGYMRVFEYGDSCDHLRVPDHATVLDTDLIVALEDLADLLDTLVERLLSTARKTISTRYRCND